MSILIFIDSWSKAFCLDLGSIDISTASVWGDGHGLVAKDGLATGRGLGKT